MTDNERLITIDPEAKHCTNDPCSFGCEGDISTVMVYLDGDCRGLRNYCQKLINGVREGKCNGWSVQ